MTIFYNTKDYSSDKVFLQLKDVLLSDTTAPSLFYQPNLISKDRALQAFYRTRLTNLYH